MVEKFAPHPDGIGVGLVNAEAHPSPAIRMRSVNVSDWPRKTVCWGHFETAEHPPPAHSAIRSDVQSGFRFGVWASHVVSLGLS
jgi:hypothetical protein